MELWDEAACRAGSQGDQPHRVIHGCQIWVKGKRRAGKAATVPKGAAIPTAPSAGRQSKVTAATCIPKQKEKGDGGGNEGAEQRSHGAAWEPQHGHPDSNTAPESSALHSQRSNPH